MRILIALASLAVSTSLYSGNRERNVSTTFIAAIVLEEGLFVIISRREEFGDLGTGN